MILQRFFLALAIAEVPQALCMNNACWNGEQKTKELSKAINRKLMN